MIIISGMQCPKKKRVPIFNYNHKSTDNITKAYVGHVYREKHNTKLRNSSVNHLSIKNMLPRFWCLLWSTTQQKYYIHNGVTYTSHN